MQDKYSLAYAMAKNGRDAFGTTDGAHDADIVSLGALSLAAQPHQQVWLTCPGQLPPSLTRR